jgi:hypothetical protein
MEIIKKLAKYKGSRQIIMGEEKIFELIKYVRDRSGNLT